MDWCDAYGFCAAAGKTLCPGTFAKQGAWYDVCSSNGQNPCPCLGNHSPRLYAVATVVEREEQPELEGGQLDLLARDPGSMRATVDLQPSKLDHAVGVGSGSPGASQHGADPQQQLTHAEGLRDVVVGAQLEADHPIDLVVPRRQHDDRDASGLRVRLDGAAHLRAWRSGSIRSKSTRSG